MLLITVLAFIVTRGEARNPVVPLTGECLLMLQNTPFNHFDGDVVRSGWPEYSFAFLGKDKILQMEYRSPTNSPPATMISDHHNFLQDAIDHFGRKNIRGIKVELLKGSDSFSAAEFDRYLALDPYIGPNAAQQTITGKALDDLGFADFNVEYFPPESVRILPFTPEVLTIYYWPKDN